MQLQTKNETRIEELLADQFLKNGNAQKALIQFQRLGNLGSPVSQDKWKELIELCIKSGKFSLVKTCYSYYTKHSLKEEEVRICLNNALNLGLIYQAQDCYTYLKDKDYEEKLLAIELQKKEVKSNPFKIFQTYEKLQIPIPIKIVKRAYRKSIKTFNAGWYDACCEILKINIDKEFLQKCLDYSLETKNFEKAKMTSEFLGVKPDKDVLLSIGDELDADKNNKTGPLAEQWYRWAFEE